MPESAAGGDRRKEPSRLPLALVVGAGWTAGASERSASRRASPAGCAGSLSGCADAPPAWTPGILRPCRPCSPDASHDRVGPASLWIVAFAAPRSQQRPRALRSSLLGARGSRWVPLRRARPPVATASRSQARQCAHGAPIPARRPRFLPWAGGFVALRFFFFFRWPQSRLLCVSSCGCNPRGSFVGQESPAVLQTSGVLAHSSRPGPDSEHSRRPVRALRAACFAERRAERLSAQRVLVVGQAGAAHRRKMPTNRHGTDRRHPDPSLPRPAHLPHQLGRDLRVPVAHSPSGGRTSTACSRASTASVPLPINLDTVNRLYGLNLTSFEMESGSSRWPRRRDASRPPRTRS
jgi:hypothetical protein